MIYDSESVSYFRYVTLIHYCCDWIRSQEKGKTLRSVTSIVETWVNTSNKSIYRKPKINCFKLFWGIVGFFCDFFFFSIMSYRLPHNWDVSSLKSDCVISAYSSDLLMYGSLNKLLKWKCLKRQPAQNLNNAKVI